MKVPGTGLVDGDDHKQDETLGLELRIRILVALGMTFGVWDEEATE